MSAQYWIAKYIEDPARNEPRNVGIIVSQAGGLAARFIGERDDGVFDARKIVGKFSHPNVYSQWRSYWRGQMAAGNLVELVRASTSNYFVEQGGEVADIGSDTVKEVTQFLFDLLVGGGPLDAYQWHIEDDDNVDLSSEIVTALDQIEVLVRGDELFARHPVARERPIAGLHVTHTPSFSQRNGHLYVFDHVDLGGTQPTKIKERAGFMGYMFSDIRAAEPSAVAYSIVRPPQANSADAIDYARIVLGSESTIINWQDDKERGGFLEERRRVAFDQAA